MPGTGIRGVQQKGASFDHPFVFVTIQDSSPPAALRSSFFVAECAACGGTVRHNMNERDATGGKESGN